MLHISSACSLTKRRFIWRKARNQDSPNDVIYFVPKLIWPTLKPKMKQFVNIDVDDSRCLQSWQQIIYVVEADALPLAG